MRNQTIIPSDVMIRESEIQKAVCEYLTLRGIFHWRANTGGAKYAGKSGKEYHVRFGFPGVADIIGIHEDRKGYRGRFLAIECKRPKGKLTLDQQAFRDAVKANGGLWILAHSVADVQRALEG